MTNRYLLLTVVPLIYILIGCSPATSTVRYGENKDYKKIEEKVRYQEPQTTDTLLTSDQDDEDPEFTTLQSENSYKIADAFSSIPKDQKTTNSTLALNLEDEFKMAIIMYHETPYKFGGNDEDGIDCSAFTQNVFMQAGNLKLHRTARDQYTQGDVISAREELVFGDLVFFDTRRRVKPGHVGIYIANGLFAHASSKHGVIISSMEENYYDRKYMGARRVLGVISN
ncbi:MAG: C40 family peptidase [Ignavibacteriaceae bacterium]|nr:C40 family peptidase [Ignavibacteriaceae bacterium]